MERRRERIRCLQELGLPESASEDDIKKAYKSAAFKYHPDKNHGEDTTNKFQQISAAYKFLIEGDSYLQHMREEASFEDIFILRFLFPWMFGTPFVPREHNPYYNYYDDSEDDDDDDVYLSRDAHATQAPSGASEHYQRNANFSQSSAQHGQFFQERTAKGKAAKKRNKEAKRATKLAAGKERPDLTKTSTSSKESQARAERVKSPTPDLSGKQQAKAQASPSREEHEKSQTPDSSSTTNSTEARKNTTEEQTNKKSKKQIQMEQKQREKELKEINEELLRQQKEQKEKLEKKRLAQEEKDRQEREARELEEREREEEERRHAEELKRLLERKEEEKKRKKREAAIRKKLFEEFDSHTFLDDNGEFKYTDPEVKNIICRDDINHLGNVSENMQHKKFETINGLDTESLIKLQEISLTKEKKHQKQEEQLGSPNHEKLGPIGSRPQSHFGSHKNHFEQQPNYHHTGQHRDNQPPGYQGRSPQHQQHPQHQYQQQHQQQQHRYQQPHHHYNNSPQPQPTHQMPFWSPTQPPPPLHNTNANIPRPSSRFHPGYPNNKRFPAGRVYTRTFSSQGFQGRV